MSQDSLIIYSPAGVVPLATPLKRAAKRLSALGFAVQVDADALSREQRFAGDDATRLAAIHRVAKAAPSIALASRGGYGLTRLLDQLDWKLLSKSVERGTRWVGMSDLTALQLAELEQQQPAFLALRLARLDAPLNQFSKRLAAQQFDLALVLPGPNQEV